MEDEMETRFCQGIYVAQALPAPENQPIHCLKMVFPKWSTHTCKGGSVREKGRGVHCTWGLVKIRAQSLAPCIYLAATLCMEPKKGTKAP